MRAYIRTHTCAQDAPRQAGLCRIGHAHTRAYVHIHGQAHAQGRHVCPDGTGSEARRHAPWAHAHKGAHTPIRALMRTYSARLRAEGRNPGKLCRIRSGPRVCPRGRMAGCAPWPLGRIGGCARGPNAHPRTQGRHSIGREPVCRIGLKPAVCPG